MRQKLLSTTFLDGCRGLAAIYVLIGHARYLAWEGYRGGYARHPESYSLWCRLAAKSLNVFAFGHDAVLFFFILSGFVIHVRYSRELAGIGVPTRFHWRTFVYRRARRLYPPLLLAIASTFLFDSLGKHLGYSIYSGHTQYHLINDNLSLDHTPLTLLGNLCFLMKVHVPVWGSDGPLWSLKYEWWFYMVYPLLLWISGRSILVSTASLGGLFVVAQVLPHGSQQPLLLWFQQIFSLFPIWWMGVLLADVYNGRVPVSFSQISVAVLFLPLSFLLPRDSLLHEYCIGLGLSGLLAACFAWQARGGRLRVLERLKPLGDMSYSLYVTHFPLLLLFGGYLMQKSADGSLPTSPGYVPIAVSISLVFGYVAYYCVERPFLSRRSHPAVSANIESRPSPAAIGANF